jgi:hypothetical protein
VPLGSTPFSVQSIRSIIDCSVMPRKSMSRVAATRFGSAGTIP